MAILAVVDEIECFDNASALTTVGQTSVKDPGQRGGFQTNFSNPLNVDLPSAISEVWLRFKVADNSATSTSNALFYLTNTGTGKDSLRLFHLTSASHPNWRFQYNSSGTTYTTLAEMNLTESEDAEFIIYWKRGASGVLKCWVNGTKIVDVSGAYNTPDTTFDRFTVRGSSTSTSTSVMIIGAAIVIADEPLFNVYVDHISPDGAGTYSEWTGSYTNVDDSANAPYWNTATDINVNATGQRFLATYESMLTLDASREVAAVQLAARGILEGGSTPTDVLFKARLSSTDYLLNSLGLTSTASNARQLLSSDPASNPWTESNVNAIEFGVETA
ncbi:MAG: hypothetical protein AB7U75_14195 [Hyphomicrobiaceae bacterium]